MEDGDACHPALPRDALARATGSRAEKMTSVSSSSSGRITSRRRRDMWLVKTSAWRRRGTRGRAVWLLSTPAAAM